MNEGVSAGVARIITENDFDGEKIINNLRRECQRVLRVLDDADALYSIRKGWFGAYGASALHDVRNAIKAVMVFYTTKDKEELKQVCREAIESADRLHALYVAIKAGEVREECTKNRE